MMRLRLYYRAHSRHEYLFTIIVCVLIFSLVHLVPFVKMKQTGNKMSSLERKRGVENTFDGAAGCGDLS